mgnify:CR=1 FL=1
MAEEMVTYDMLEGPAKDWADVQEIHIRVETTKLFCFVLAGLISPLIMQMLRLESQDPSLWFQRSGSIMVVLALLAELRVLTIDRLIVARDHSFLYCHMYIEQKYLIRLKVISYVPYVVVALGTVIWGYGDLVYAAIFSEQ